MTSHPRPQSRLLCRQRSKLTPALTLISASLLVGCQATANAELVARPPAQPQSDPLNTTFVIGDRPVRLIHGEDEQPAAPGSSSKIITRIWGAPVAADLNGDGIDDAVLILTQSTGGSGTFYYAAAAIAEPTCYKGTAGVLLGDRVKPQSIDIDATKARISFLTRGYGESFADDPTVPRQIDVIYVAKDRRLAEVAIDFEGEADPNRITLQMHTWTWIRTVFNNDTVNEPKTAGVFKLTFDEHGPVSGTTDCNSFQGRVSVEKHKIQFDEYFAMTRVFCADSQEAEFIEMLRDINSFFFTSRGRLIMELKYDSGSMFFQ
ncbi:MAG: META domain-containing protein [Sedimenticolaceae bacterium]